ncbi:hypothetical protein MesoLjLc_50670 [Mesorhizobium sp. L-8-10]|uniref:hypothetical protein n=1 Tax=Mesorhizobium sp. L-8-10 TaxID=2744523 RepID=UPI001926D0A4|nr:hypothetical protein [Mesorhizobium sp. L-8-10]BCH33137.1 hypothetical protein MesoLjLc_50670 [Mesorhizobium sp. L-8-10]
MAQVISLADRAAAMQMQQQERIRQASHCTCLVSPAPKAPPRLERTEAGWKCSECGVIVAGPERNL